MGRKRRVGFDGFFGDRDNRIESGPIMHSAELKGAKPVYQFDSYYSLASDLVSRMDDWMLDWAPKLRDLEYTSNELRRIVNPTMTMWVLNGGIFAKGVMLGMLLQGELNKDGEKFKYSTEDL